MINLAVGLAMMLMIMPFVLVITMGIENVCPPGSPLWKRIVFEYYPMFILVSLGLVLFLMGAYFVGGSITGTL